MTFLTGTLAAVKDPVSETPALYFARVTSTPLGMSAETTHTHICAQTQFKPLKPRVVTRCRDTATWPMALWSFRDGRGKMLSPTLCVCVFVYMCVLDLCHFLATVRDSGLRTITDITHDSHVTTQGHYTAKHGPNNDSLGVQ